MPVIFGTVTVPGNSTVAAFTVPPGYSNMTLYQPSQAQGVFIGNSSTVSKTSGVALTSTPANSETSTGSSGTTFFATTGNATAATFCYLVSSTN